MVFYCQHACTECQYCVNVSWHFLGFHPAGVARPIEVKFDRAKHTITMLCYAKFVQRCGIWVSTDIEIWIFAEFLHHTYKPHVPFWWYFQVITHLHVTRLTPPRTLINALPTQLSMIDFQHVQFPKIFVGSHRELVWVQYTPPTQLNWTQWLSLSASAVSIGFYCRISNHAFCDFHHAYFCHFFNQKKELHLAVCSRRAGFTLPSRWWFSFLVSYSIFLHQPECLYTLMFQSLSEAFCRRTLS